MNNNIGKSSVTSFNSVKKNNAHLASEFKANKQNVLNQFVESSENNEPNDEQVEFIEIQPLDQTDLDSNISIDTDKDTYKEKAKESIKKAQKKGKKVLIKAFFKKHKIIIIAIGCGLLILFFLILLIGFLPNVGGILELTNNNENNKFTSKDDGNDGEVIIGNDSTPYLINDGFTHFFQYNYGHVSYGYGTTIASAGCCPTAMAMILTNITGQMITPIETANFSLKNGYRVEGNGTAWAFMPAVGSAYGVQCTQINTDASSIQNSLLNGSLISMSVNPGHFSTGGHFIVLRKITEDGRIVVADPNSEERSKMAWDISIFPSEAAAAWACSK